MRRKSKTCLHALHMASTSNTPETGLLFSDRRCEVPAACQPQTQVYPRSPPSGNTSTDDAESPILKTDIRMEGTSLNCTYHTWHYNPIRIYSVRSESYYVTLSARHRRFEAVDRCWMARCPMKRGRSIGRVPVTSDCQPAARFSGAESMVDAGGGCRYGPSYSGPY